VVTLCEQQREHLLECVEIVERRALTARVESRQRVARAASSSAVRVAMLRARVGRLPASLVVTRRF
jgi:hypothetical protein